MWPFSDPTRYDAASELADYFETQLAAEDGGFRPKSLGYNRDGWRFDLERFKRWAQDIDSGARTDAEKFDVAFRDFGQRLYDAADDGAQFLWENVKTTVQETADDARKTVTQPLGVPLEIWVGLALVVAVAVYVVPRR